MSARRTLLVVVLALASFLGPVSVSAQQVRWVGEVGCSNSLLIAQSYTNVSSRDVLWSAAQNSAALSVWAQPGGPWTGFDKQFRQKGATAIWYPLCIHVNEFASQDAAWSAFLAFNALLRQRTQAPLWLTPTIGSQPSCAAGDNALMGYVVGRAVTEGYALRSSPDIPAASAPLTDQCHFDPIASTNVGAAAAQFLDN